MNKKFRIILILVLIIGVGYWFFTRSHGDKKQTNALPVTVISVYQKPLYDSVEALGTAYANESINITANATETIREIRFEDGQSVKKGDVIAVLEQSEEQAQLRGAEARLNENQRELKRLQGLLQNKAAAKKEFDERQTMVSVSEQDVKEIKARIADRTLTAPFDGLLGLRRLSVGALVQPGDIITTLDDIHQIKLDFTVPDIYLTQLKAGTEIEATSESFGQKIFKGAVSMVDLRVDPVTRSVQVRAIIPNDDGLIKPGVLMHVTLLKNAREAIVVPEEAVLQKQDKQFVLVVDPQSFKVEQRQIDVGMRRPGIIEVKSGIKVGEMVIVRGISLVRPDQEVTIQEVWGEIKAPDDATQGAR